MREKRGRGKWRQKDKLRDGVERFNNRKTKEVLPCYSFIIGLQGRSNEKLLIAHNSHTILLVHLHRWAQFKRALGQMKR